MKNKLLNRLECDDFPEWGFTAHRLDIDSKLNDAFIFAFIQTSSVFSLKITLEIAIESDIRGWE